MSDIECLDELQSLSDLVGKTVRRVDRISGDGEARFHFTDGTFLEVEVGSFQGYGYCTYYLAGTKE